MSIEAADGPIPAGEALGRLITGATVTRLLGLAAEYRIADRLSEGPRHVDELAAELRLAPQPLYRAMRALASHGVFAEVEPRSFEVTPTGQLLRSDVPGSQRLWAMFNGAHWYWDAIGHIGHSLKTGEPAFTDLYEQSSFEFYNSDPAAGRLFYDMMTQMTGELLPVILENYDFSPLRHAVDVGAAQGALLKAVMEKHPAIEGTLFDLPVVIDRLRAELAESPLAPRMKLEAGDFFEALPEGADAYLLKYIIHDWGDGECVSILSNCRRAMDPDGRVLVIENVIAPGNGPCPGKMLDLTMMLMEGGRERTAEEFSNLFERAGLRLRRQIPLAGSMHILEAEAA